MLGYIALDAGGNAWTWERDQWDMSMADTRGVSGTCNSKETVGHVGIYSYSRIEVGGIW